MQGPGGGGATPFEVAVLVSHYLESGNFNRTAAAFRKEAKSVLGSGPGRPLGQPKSLLDVLNGYLQLQYREEQRVALQRTNPLAAPLYTLLDCYAGVAAPHAMPFHQQQHHQQQLAAYGGPPLMSSSAEAAAQLAAVAAYLPPPPPTQQQEQQQEMTLGMVPLGVYGGGGEAAAGLQQGQQGQGAEGMDASPSQQQQQATPGRHGNRKGSAPPRKRPRRLEDTFYGTAAAGGAAAGGGGAGHVAPGSGGPLGEGSNGPWSYQDLMNMPLDVEALTTLLSDETLQARFATRLTHHLSTLNPLGSGGSEAAAAAEGGAEGVAGAAGPDFLFGSLDEMLSELPGDPEMAALLQTFVRVPSPPPLAAGMAEATPLPQQGPPPTAAALPTQQQQHQQQGQPQEERRQQPQHSQGTAGTGAAAGAAAASPAAAAPVAQGSQQPGPIAGAPGSGDQPGKENRRQELGASKQQQQQEQPAVNGQQQQQHQGSQQQVAPQQQASTGPPPQQRGKRDLKAELQQMGLQLPQGDLDALIDDDLLGD